MQLGDITVGLRLEGVIPSQVVTVVAVGWHGPTEQSAFNFEEDDS